MNLGSKNGGFFLHRICWKDKRGYLYDSRVVRNLFVEAIPSDLLVTPP